MNWADYGLEGSLIWNHLPSTLVFLYLPNNNQCGALCENFEQNVLPASLTFVSIARNRFTGPLLFACLPQLLEVLNISENQFSGNVDFTLMPTSLMKLYVNGNARLEGTLHVEELEKMLSYDVRATRIVVKNGLRSRMK